MSIVAFDTLAAARSLEAAGFAQKQAEAITNAVRDAVTENVATKPDVERLEEKVERLDEKVERLDEKIDAVRSEIRADIARLSARMDALMLRFAVLGIGLVGVAVAATKLL